ncbi:hypothetical protein XAP3CFBP6996_005435 [Xanthomonas citri pv. fuscans CFBP 6996]|uniref:hypothetical protein n=1 Tax=Xanthomonas citri TaxID=346 RepID=UPI000C17FC8D|nr:hypothetical protein [Xanthomonas citri]ATS50763.1 hypothetical protein XcfCFBP6992P_07500 [Xanthomonas citri pv. phaseoli var. fuscans]ATS56498.1 hypothetical protein XcfCFBP6994P_16225 [Xanthomonas citri pv. phaseoli var. fuscans]ATS59494.1 hypothetical protein XcfCFBP6996P_09505 [Xanthomonas citri pv. phaseoli var. fuscans]PTY31437.1 hypothetical protein XAP3CFBP6996_005435 [Xanthomonas citri pv. fuscans CFBP 6996]QWN15372.1 hypothetical protein DGN02_05450 [Xanthomonas citri]
MSTSLRHALVFLAALTVAGCKQQPADPVATQPQPAVSAPATPPSDDAQARALEALEARLQGDHVYPDNCISIMAEDGDAPAPDTFDFAVRERHGDGCPGDPQTSPVRDRFRVQADGTLLWYDVVNADFVDYAERARSLQ